MEPLHHLATNTSRYLQKLYHDSIESPKNLSKDQYLIGGIIVVLGVATLVALGGCLFRSKTSPRVIKKLEPSPGQSDAASPPPGSSHPPQPTTAEAEGVIKGGSSSPRGASSSTSIEPALKVLRSSGDSEKLKALLHKLKSINPLESEVRMQNFNQCITEAGFALAEKGKLDEKFKTIESNCLKFDRLEKLDPLIVELQAIKDNISQINSPSRQQLTDFQRRVEALFSKINGIINETRKLNIGNDSEFISKQIRLDLQGVDNLTLANVCALGKDVLQYWQLFTKHKMCIEASLKLNEQNQLYTMLQDQILTLIKSRFSALHSIASTAVANNGLLSQQIVLTLGVIRMKLINVANPLKPKIEKLLSLLEDFTNSQTLNEQNSESGLQKVIQILAAVNTRIEGNSLIEDQRFFDLLNLSKLQEQHLDEIFAFMSKTK